MAQPQWKVSILRRFLTAFILPATIFLVSSLLQNADLSRWTYIDEFVVTLPTSLSPTQPRLAVTYELLSNNTFRNIYNPFMGCGGRTLDPSFLPMLDFSVQVSTHLKILFLGDSVSVMTAQMYQELAQAKERHVIRYSWGTTEGTHVASVEGGGIVAGWRITGWMLEKGRTDQDFPNVAGGKWMASDVPLLMNHTFDNRTSVDAFDAMILRIPHGWMKLEEITRDALIESLKIAHKNFGFRVVIITTLPFVNNIQNADDLHQLQGINAMFRDFCDTYRSGNNTIEGVDSVMTLDFDVLVDQLIQHNGRLLGYNESEISTNDYLFDQCCPAKRLKRSKPVICPGKDMPCRQGNGFTMDGMHWCNEALNGRLGAGISCLLNCGFTDNGDSVATQDICAKACNDRFMNLHQSDMTGLIEHKEML